MTWSRRVALGISFWIALLAACGGSKGGDSAPPAGDDGGAERGGDAAASPSDAGEAGDVVDAATSDVVGPFAPAAHAAQPQVYDNGGMILDEPKVQLIYYAGDAFGADAQAMLTELAGGSAWSTQTSEYGVGALTVLPAIVLQGTPPATLDDSTVVPTPWQQMVIADTTGPNPAWGAADPSTIYTYLVQPALTDVKTPGTCCANFGGYHWQAPISSSENVPYAIICECPASAGSSLTELQGVTATVSHELAETATDPFTTTLPAWNGTDLADSMWSLATGGEIADMCEYDPDAVYTPPGATYSIQRTWSNAAAAAGTNPCVPVPSTGPYVDAMAVQSDMIALTYDGSRFYAPGVEVPVGSSKTVDVQVWSSQPTSGPWTVRAYDLAAFLGQAPFTTVSLDKTTASNGDVLHLTIEVDAANPTWSAEGFVLESSLGGQKNLWYGAVGN